MDELQQSGPPQQPSTSTGFTMQRSFIVALLMLLNVVVPFAAIVAVILAYVWRRDAQTQDWEKTHFTYLIRTFWISFAIGITVIVLWFGAFIGMVIQAEAGGSGNRPPPSGFFVSMFGAIGLYFLGMLWAVVRSVLSMAKSGSGTPMPNPETWWF